MKSLRGKKEYEYPTKKSFRLIFFPLYKVCRFFLLPRHLRINWLNWSTMPLNLDATVTVIVNRPTLATSSLILSLRFGRIPW